MTVNSVRKHDLGIYTFRLKNADSKGRHLQLCASKATEKGRLCRLYS